MVHALRKLHTSIRPGGTLLDIHPQTQMPGVAVVRDGERIDAGVIDWTTDNIDIRAARRRLARLEREGLFEAGPRVRFRTADYFDSVNEWLQLRKERNYTSTVPGETIRAARKEMRGGNAKLAVLLRVRATLYRRRP